MKLYFAGPLFSAAETVFNQSLTQKIESLGIEVFLPQRDGLLPEMDSPEDKSRAIFALDRERIFASDLFLYVLDGRVPTKELPSPSGWPTVTRPFRIKI